MAFLCVFQQGEFKNAINVLGGNPCQSVLAEKVERKKLFSCRLFPSIFVVAFFLFFFSSSPLLPTYFFFKTLFRFFVWFLENSL
jgi:hypothetical protein